MGLAADTWATAANVIDTSSQLRATNEAVAATAQQLPAVTPTMEVTLTSEPTEVAIVLEPCQNIASTQFEVISGPTLAPEPGYSYTVGSIPPKPEVSWVLKNTGECIWERIFLWSLLEGQLKPAIIRTNGQEISLGSISEITPITINPGDEIEIVLKFLPSEAASVRGEWVLMINDLSLFNRPHLLVDVDGWVISVEFEPTPTKIFRTPKPTSSTGGNPTTGSPGGPPGGRP
jgi:hypothetical protein